MNVVSKQRCAFVTYTTRDAAEKAVEKSFQKLNIYGQRLTIRWGRSQGKRSNVATDDGDNRMKLAPVPGLPVGAPDYFGLGSSSSSFGPSASAGSAIPSLPLPSGIHYPSQDPLRLGSTSVKLPNFNKD